MRLEGSRPVGRPAPMSRAGGRMVSGSKSGRHDCSSRPLVEGGVVPGLEPPGAWVSSSPVLPPVPRSSGPVARLHVREEHVGGAALRRRRGLDEGGRKAVWKPGQALIVTDSAPHALYGLGAVHVEGPGEVHALPAAPAV